MTNFEEELDFALMRHNGWLGVTREDPDTVTPDTKKTILQAHKAELEQESKELTMELDTEQCVEVALYMYQQWQEAMEPPLLIYKDFPTWLKDLLVELKGKE